MPIEVCSYCKVSRQNLTLRRSGDRWYAWCRSCNTKIAGRYGKTEKGKQARNAASKRAYQKHKIKWYARIEVRNAVKKGLLVKPKKCEVCKLVKPLQGHHEDYSKPLEVIWLCTGCHADADKKREKTPLTP